MVDGLDLVGYDDSSIYRGNTMKDTAIYVEIEQSHIETYNNCVDIPSMEVMRYDTEPYYTVSRKPVVRLKRSVHCRDEQGYQTCSDLEDKGFTLVEKWENLERHGVNVSYEKRIVLSDEAQSLFDDLIEDKKSEWRDEICRMRSLFEKEEKQKKELDKRIEDYNNLSFWQKLKRGFKL